MTRGAFRRWGGGLVLPILPGWAWVTSPSPWGLRPRPPDLCPPTTRLGRPKRHPNRLGRLKGPGTTRPDGKGPARLGRLKGTRLGRTDGACARLGRGRKQPPRTPQPRGILASCSRRRPSSLPMATGPPAAMVVLLELLTSDFPGAPGRQGPGRLAFADRAAPGQPFPTSTRLRQRLRLRLRRGAPE